MYDKTDSQDSPAQTPPSESGNQEADGVKPPEGIAEKFWDPLTQEIKTDALIQSYQELERMVSRPEVPESPDAYDLDLPDSGLVADEEINARLHDAGFSQKQAQLVYDLAHEKLAPVITQVAGRVSAQHEVGRLERHFGGAEKWGSLAKQIGDWGGSNLSPESFQALAATYDGVLAMHKMMTERTSDPEIGAIGSNAGDVLPESKLKEIMNNPHYWRDGDPEIVSKVTEGFERLYPSKS